jgi:hypothetical protein
VATIIYSFFQITYREANIKQEVHTQFLRLDLDSHMNWKIRVNKIIPTLSRACYVIKSVYFLYNVSIFKTIHYAYFHSVME